MLRKLLRPDKQFAGHSFRRGGASFALQAGLPTDVIMLFGDWHSDAYRCASVLQGQLCYAAGCCIAIESVYMLYVYYVLLLSYSLLFIWAWRFVSFLHWWYNAYICSIV